MRTKHCKVHTAIKSWRYIAANRVNISGLQQNDHVEPLPERPRAAPWVPEDGITLNPHLTSLIHRDDPPAVRLAAALETIEQLPKADVVVYTDGSAKHSVYSGGSGIYITYNGLTYRGRKPAGTFTSSYRAEVIALAQATKHLLTLPLAPSPQINIFTDSQSAIMRLRSGRSTQTGVYEDQIWDNLLQLQHNHNATIVVQYVPGHCGLPGNEEADKLAGEARRLDQSNINFDLTTAYACIRRVTNRAWSGSQPREHLHFEVTGGHRPVRVPSHSRNDDVLLSRLRTGHSPILLDYRIRFNLYTEQLSCSCGAPETLSHLLVDCTQYAAARKLCFPEISDQPSLSTVFRQPDGVLSFLRSIDRYLPPANEWKRK